MLAAIRVFAKSWVAAVLMGLLIVSFAVFGIRDVFGGHTSNAVVTAGSREVSDQDYRREFEAIRRRAEQQMEQPVSVEAAAANGLDRQVLQGIATRESFAAFLTKLGIRPSDKLVAEQLRKIPAFFDPVSGRFDKKQYEQRLAQNELTPGRFEAMLRDDMAERHLFSPMMNSLLIPRAYSAMAAIYALENRDLAYLSVEPGNVAPPAAPTDQQLTEFMRENAAQLTQPEFRVLTVVRFSPQAIATDLPVDQAELKKRYDFRKDTLATPETRTLVQIPAKDAATGQQIVARLARGDSPAAVAKSVGVDAITYENKPQTALPDRRMAAEAFKLTPGQVAVLPGDLGPAVVKVVSVTPGRSVSFEQARPALEAELRKDAATEKVYALTQAYDEAHQKGSSLTEAAKKAGVPAVTIGPLARDGRSQQGQPVAGLSQKLVDSAFALPAGGESELTEAGGGEYFAVRVDKVIPPAIPPLAAIKPQLSRAWMLRETAKRMQARAEELAARVRKGESLEQVAAASGTKLVRVPGVDRQSGAQNPLVSQEMLAGVFGSKPGEVFTGRNRTFGFVVGKVEAIHVGDPPTLARMAEQARPQMTATVFREWAEGAQTAARQKMKVKIDFKRARAAIGLPPLNEAGKPEKAK